MRLRRMAGSAGKAANVISNLNIQIPSRVYRLNALRRFAAVMSGALFVLAASVCGALAQQQSPGTETEEPLVKVNVDLVQMDVIVTDSKGLHVTNLSPQEFEILEDGKPRQITNFSYIQTGTAPPPVSVEETRVQAVAPARLAPGQVTRSIVVFLDDLGLSDRSFLNVHGALKTIAEKQMRDGDLIALVTASGKLGSLQALSSDKRVFVSAVERFRSVPNHRTGVLDDDFTCEWFKHRWLNPSNGALSPAGASQDADAWLSLDGTMGPEELTNDRRGEYYGMASIAALRRVVDAMKDLPGRKSIMLFSEGVPLIRAQGVGDPNRLLVDAYEAVLTHADRSAITVNTIDPRGLLTPFGVSSEDITADTGGPGSCPEARQMELVNSQTELAEIARRTGGIAIKESSDFSDAIGRVMQDDAGYYLIGYKPSPQTGKRASAGVKFRKLAVRLKRPGLKARFHSGLYDTEELAVRPPAAAGRRLAAALTSPFALRDVGVKVASMFWDSGASGLILQSTIQIDARTLRFSAESDGRHKGEFELIAVTYAVQDRPLDKFEKGYVVTLTPTAYEKALVEGLVQRFQMVVKQPGPYQIRAVVRDKASDHIGSSSQFVDVPDLGHSGLALSGIVLSDAEAKNESSEPVEVQKCRRGQRVEYSCQVLNAKPGREGAFHVEVRASLFREGKILGTSSPIVIDGKSKADPKHLLIRTDFQLGKQLQPGDYVLQLSAEDKNAPARRAKATQLTEFEVLE